ncbi:hypothetical protein BD311DRAFT_748482 [Dichomitus squalens]|uniref:Heterokaryon incompatibility domain-containing protein n=1 Tax=Dichomitus squalens TaxID=114155 RepID=A0A4Q9N2E9_9APHY|nr:hypothetical protein BD311DRAFT_748482 [Dichomitus squalens]
MRCLDTHTGEFVDINPEWTNYAILSHTWNEGGEQTYTELREIQKRCCSRGHPPQGGARGLPPFLSSSLEVPSGSTPPYHRLTRGGRFRTTTPTSDRQGADLRRMTQPQHTRKSPAYTVP